MHRDFSLTATSRRGFLQQASILLAGPAGLVLGRARGDETGFVVAETASGKIRGVDAQGIKVFRGVPYGGTTSGVKS